METHPILMVAAEASSCLYAKRLMHLWRQEFPESHFYGVGDREMQAQGMECFGLAEDMAVMGFQEVIKHYGAIRKVAHKLLDEVEKKPPRFALLLDYPGFNLRLAKSLKALNVPVVYYISPQLWAWKKGRVRQVQKYVDEMLVVFPFEVDFYKQYGIKAHFVGHPLVEVVASEQRAREEEEKEFKKEELFKKRDEASSQEKPRKEETPKKEEKPPLRLGLMPGSRLDEVGHHFPLQWETAQSLKKHFDMEVKVLMAPSLGEKDFEAFTPELSPSPFLKGSPTEMIQSCDVILAASGTATLQVALCEKPMVVMYRMNPLTAFLARRLVRSVNRFCIVNLIAGRDLVPELFQEQAHVEALVKELSPLLESSQKREEMVQGLRKLKTQLGHGGATAKVVSFLKERMMTPSLKEGRRP